MAGGHCWRVSSLSRHTIAGVQETDEVTVTELLFPIESVSFSYLISLSL